MAKLREKIARIALGDILSRGIGFITTVYLARTIGAEGYGLVTIALSFLGYQVWIADLGLLNIGAREMAKEPVKRTFRAKEIFVAKILLGVFVFGLSYLLIPESDLTEEKQQLFMGFTFSLIPYTLLMEWYYNGRQKFGKVAVSKVLNSLVYLILIFFLVESVQDIQTIPYLYTIGLSFSALAVGFMCLFDKPFELPMRGWNVFKDLFRSASTIGIGWFFTQTIQLLPPLVIGFMLSETDAGLYGAAIRIIIAAMILDRIFVNLLLPNLSSQWSANRGGAIQNVQIVSKVMLSAGALLGLFLAIASPWIIEILYGEEYAGSSDVLSILSLFLFLTFINSLFSFGLVAIGKDREFFYSTLIGGVFTVLSLFGVAYIHDLNLVTTAVVVSEFIFVVASYYWFRKYIRLRMAGAFIVTLSSGMLVYYLSGLINFPLILEAIAGCILLTLLLIVTGIFTSEHLEWVRKKLN